MKKLIIILVFLLLQNVVAHLQETHQRITIEAYELLKLYQGGDITEMQNHLGTMADISNGPWKTGLILTGAFREDTEDVVFKYSNLNPPTVTGPDGAISNAALFFVGLFTNAYEAYSSVTHFWEPDDGDVTGSTIKVYKWQANYQFTVPNAYTKIKKYANGGWTINDINTDYLFEYNGSEVALYNSLPESIRHFSYSNLITLYETGNVNLELALGHYYLKKRNGQVVRQFGGGSVVLKLNENIKNKVVWEILGRMAHLLQDMTIPAHVHNDAHGDDADGIRLDPYEDSFGSLQWSASQLLDGVGELFDVLDSDEDPIHYLMFTNAQVSDHYAGAGPYSTRIDDLIEGDYSTNEYNYLNSLNLSTWDGPTSFNITLTNAQLTSIRNKLIPQAIRSTAGLLYWFAKEANILPLPPSVSVSPVTYNVGSGRMGNYYYGDFAINNTGGTTLNLTIQAPFGVYFDEQNYSQIVYKTLIPGQTIGIDYFGSYGASDYGPFTTTIHIYDNNSINKTHTIVGTRLLPDFCYGETQARSSSPEEQLFDGAFLGYFGIKEGKFSLDKSKSIKERLDFAYNLLERKKTENVEDICKTIIELYPESEMSISFYAIGLLWEAAYSKEAPNFNEKNFREYLKELTSSKNKYKINGYAQLILSLLDVGKDIKGLERLFNDYEYDGLKELALFHQFVHYFVYEGDKKSAREISDKLDKMFKDSRYGYQAHLIFGDKGYTQKGLLELVKKQRKSLLEKRAEIKTDILSELPTEYRLYNNYPNPFNPTTTIKYSVPRVSNVKLSVYNMMGQLVKTLVDGTKAPGFYNIEWNGTNENNSKVTSGIYFYRFESGNFVSNNKMILLK